jgi:putative intracellular protease/amidase
LNADARDNVVNMGRPTAKLTIRGAIMARVIIPIPRRDFDPSEAAVSWKLLTERGHAVAFATPDSGQAEADPMMLTGRGLDPWGFIPGLNRIKALGLIVRANRDARHAYRGMAACSAFQKPLHWQEVSAAAFDGLLLPGGHWARGMREYLESPGLQSLVAEFFAADKPVAAICHGVLLAARSRNAAGKSVLYGRKTTALTWALEGAAESFGRIARFWDPHYYRTYPDRTGQPKGYRSVQQEVTRALASPADFIDVPKGVPDYRMKTSGLARDSMTDERPAWVVCDRNYASARWPGDVHTFAKQFAGLLEGYTKSG